MLSQRPLDLLWIFEDVLHPMSLWLCTYLLTWMTENPHRYWNLLTVEPLRGRAHDWTCWRLFLPLKPPSDTNLQVLTVWRLQLSLRTPGAVSLLTIQPANTHRVNAECLQILITLIKSWALNAVNRSLMLHLTSCITFWINEMKYTNKMYYKWFQRWEINSEWSYLLYSTC